jgi:hypothetical protein
MAPEWEVECWKNKVVLRREWEAIEWSGKAGEPLEVVLHCRQFMPVAGLPGLIAAYLSSRMSLVMIVILYIVPEQIASGVAYQCVLQLLIH